MPKKIFLLGSAPSSLPLAPHDDPTATLWGCSPGACTGIAGKRVDAWFEMHRITKDFPWFTDGDPYWKFLKEFKGTVWMLEPHPEIPNSRRYPVEYMLEKWGPFFWQSSLSYMAAMALEDPELEVLGWRGVDMAAVEEYAQQKPACQFFIWQAMQRGIYIDIPPESDLFYPQQMYGYSEINPHRIKLDVRARELLQRIHMTEQNLENGRKEYWLTRGLLSAMNGEDKRSKEELLEKVKHLEADLEKNNVEKFFIKGAFDDNTYHLQTYVQHPYAVGVLAKVQERNAIRLSEKHGQGKHAEDAGKRAQEGHAEQGNGRGARDGARGPRKSRRRKVSGAASAGKSNGVHIAAGENPADAGGGG